MVKRPRVMLNPSCQYGNQIFDEQGNEIYNEGHNLWNFAVEIKKRLDADGRVESFISRESRECESSLDAESQMTQDLGCDCLVALHSDATGTSDPGGGTWTFFTGETHWEENELAALPYRLEDSRRLADLVQSHTLEAIRRVYPEVLDKGVREHWNRLRMLHKPMCVACLIEILFHTNPFEREMLKNPVFQSLIGDAIARAILRYFGLPDAEESPAGS